MAERISFTRPSAERIANAVRVVEQSRPRAAALGFRRQDAVPNAKVFRVATFTGAWAIGASKVVTLKYRDTTPNTVLATNLFFPITSTAAGTRDCGIAKDGTAWFLIDVRLATAAITYVASTQYATVVSSVQSVNVVQSISLAATLNTSNCAITIGQTVTTQTVQVVSGTSSISVAGGTASAAVIVFNF